MPIKDILINSTICRELLSKEPNIFITLIYNMKILIFLLLVSFCICLDNGLGKTPPMGWNSWNRFKSNINETLIRQTADLLVSTGLSAKGYRYVNLDDCWQIDRNSSTSQIIEDKTKFPSGMAKLGQYIHSKSLLYGLYSCAGFKTCQGRPGSLGHEKVDALTYAKWQVDYLKYDNCNHDSTSSKVRYPAMRDALNASGRHIFFSMCQWGEEQPWTWASPVGNSWRTTGDINGHYNSMISILEKQKGLSKYSGPGYWNDPDMLQVGNGLMTHDEYQTHFAFWCALKSPLLIGCNLKGITKATLQILGNEEVIAVNQDSLGKQADFLYQEKGISHHKQVWGGQLSNRQYVIICFNRFDIETVFTLNLKTLFPSKKVSKIREIIDRKDENVPSNQQFKTKIVKTHAVAMYVITLESNVSLIQD